MSSISDTDSVFIERFLSAFKTIGGNELGFIDYNVFKNLINKKTGIDVNLILNLINEEQHVREGKLDYISLCFSLMTFKTIFNSFSSENGKVLPINPVPNAHTYLKSKGFKNEVNTYTNDSKKSSLKIPFKKSLKGLLFYKNKDQLGYRYQLELLENSMVEIFAMSISEENHSNKIPVEILIFQDGKKKQFVTSSSVINDEGYCAVEMQLRKGKYILIPILLKWDQISEDNAFTQDTNFLMRCTEDSSPEFTQQCEKGLKEVFDAIDIDGNNLLSQTEFDLFIRYTSGETAVEEWTTVEDNFNMKNGQLTYDGFLELYRLVLQTDPPDLLNMFQQMGVNDEFKLKNAQPFTLIVSSDGAKFNLSPLPVSSYLEVAEKVIKKVAMELGISSKVKDMNDLILYKYHLPHRVTLVIQNQSHSKINVNIDCSGSVNCESHRRNLCYSTEISPRTSKIIHHLLPIDASADWNVVYKESFITSNKLL